ncbi:hypothetical protein G6F23_015626 [Rhizopus arrhizus]|nr:hypothetical protein G6F23_015626 [Rhizopus arrhizus]
MRLPASGRHYRVATITALFPPSSGATHDPPDHQHRKGSRRHRPVLAGRARRQHRVLLRAAPARPGQRRHRRRR